MRRAALDYGRVEAALRMAEVAMTPQLFDDLQVIEVGAILADREETDW